MKGARLWMYVGVIDGKLNMGSARLHRTKEDAVRFPLEGFVALEVEVRVLHPKEIPGLHGKPK